VAEALLDTDILSEVIKGVDPRVAAKAAQHRERFGPYAVSTITVMEIVHGSHRMGRDDRIRQFLAGLHAVDVLPFDIESAELAGCISADLERSGQPIGLADPMIASIALRHRLTLVTGNLNHFRRIQDLGCELLLEDWRT